MPRRELQQIKINQDQLREQREQELTIKLPAVHLLEIAERELEFINAAEALHLRLQKLEAQRVKQLAIYQNAHPRPGSTKRTARSAAEGSRVGAEASRTEDAG